VKASAKKCVRGSSELFRALVTTMMASDSSFFGSMYLHSNVLAKEYKETIADLKVKQVLASVVNTLQKEFKGRNVLQLELLSSSGRNIAAIAYVEYVCKSRGIKSVCMVIARGSQWQCLV
jgi:hypothetical protein